VSSVVARWHNGIDQLPLVHERFRHVQIESEDWRTIINRYDTRKTLFYVDPPYVPSTRTRDGGKYEYEMDEGAHRNLVARLLAIRGMSVVSGYYHPIYNLLDQSGWKRVDNDVPTYSSVKRVRRTECLWLSPSVLSCVDTPTKPMPSTPIDRMIAGAHHTHEVRVKQTTKQIVRVIERLRQSGEEPTMAAVARILGVSREHLSRRYRHLFSE
jgi:DNA adenine methylase